MPLYFLRVQRGMLFTLLFVCFSFMPSAQTYSRSQRLTRLGRNSSNTGTGTERVQVCVFLSLVTRQLKIDPHPSPAAETLHLNAMPGMRDPLSICGTSLRYRGHHVSQRVLTNGHGPDFMAAHIPSCWLIHSTAGAPNSSQSEPGAAKVCPRPAASI